MTGDHYESLWLFASVEHIDFDWKEMINECQLVSIVTKGGFGYESLKEMEFDMYDFTIKNLENFIPKQTAGGNQDA